MSTEVTSDSYARLLWETVSKHCRPPEYGGDNIEPACEFATSSLYAIARAVEMGAWPEEKGLKEVATYFGCLACLHRKQSPPAPHESCLAGYEDPAPPMI